MSSGLDEYAAPVVQGDAELCKEGTPNEDFPTKHAYEAGDRITYALDLNRSFVDRGLNFTAIWQSPTQEAVRRANIIRKR